MSTMLTKELCSKIMEIFGVEKYGENTSDEI